MSKQKTLKNAFMPLKAFSLTMHELRLTKTYPQNQNVQLSSESPPHLIPQTPNLSFMQKRFFLSTLEQPSARRRGYPAHNQTISQSILLEFLQIRLLLFRLSSKVDPPSDTWGHSIVCEASSNHWLTFQVPVPSIHSVILCSILEERKWSFLFFQLFNHCLCHGCLFTKAHSCYLRVSNFIRLLFVLSA